MIFCAVISAGVDPEGTEERFLFATNPFHTGAGGSPANTPAYGRLLQPANFERSIASGKLIFGLTEIGYGECVIANEDGAHDVLMTYAVDGRDFVLWAVDPGNTASALYESFPSDGWVQIFQCTMQSITGDGSVLRVRLREQFFELNERVCPTFLGTGEDEGTADMVGQPKPMVFGSAYNASPVLLDPAYLTYLVSATGYVFGHHAKDSGSVIARDVNDNEEVLVIEPIPGGGSIYRPARLDEIEVAIGHYRTDCDAGMIRLGSPPVGQVTVDAAARTVVDALTTTTDNPADVIKDVLGWAGIATTGASSQIDADDFDDLSDWADTEESRVGYYVRDLSTTFARVISDIAASIGAWIGADRLGKFRTAIVIDPADMTSTLSIGEDDVISIRRVVSGDPGKGVPYSTITQKYPRNWTPQSSGLAGVVPPAVRKEVAEQFPLSAVTVCAQLSSSPPATISVTTQFLKAPDYLVESYGAGQRVTSTGALVASPPASGAQFAALLGVPRDWIEVVLPLRIADIEAVDIGGCVTVMHPRFGLAYGTPGFENGKQFMVVAIRYELSGSPTATLTLWG